MNTRDPRILIAQMLSEIPDEELGFKMVLEKLRHDALYRAPEQIGDVFICLATILGNYISKINHPWQQAVVDIFEDRGEWRVFRMNDCDWYLARSLKDAINVYAKDTQVPLDELLSDPREVLNDELDRLQYFEEGLPNGTSRSFKSELLRRIHAGPKVELFATTEF